MKLSHNTEYSNEIREMHEERCTVDFSALADIIEIASVAAPDMRASVETHKTRFFAELDKPENAHLKILFAEHIAHCDSCRNVLIMMASEHQNEVDFIRFCRAS